MAQAEDLGTLILRLNPYTNRRQNPIDADSRKMGEMDIYCVQSAAPGEDGKYSGSTKPGIRDIQLEVEGPYQHEWTFRGQPRRVGMAVRVRYRFPIKDKDGTVLYWADDYLLVGYEGSMGG